MSDASPIRQTPTRYDETRHQDGSLRTEWGGLLQRIQGMSDAQLDLRLRSIDRQLRSNGLGYHPNNKRLGKTRTWQLDLIPVIYDADSWAQLSVGLDQRARLKQALYRDIYGPQRLLRKGVIPPSMLYAHDGYLRDMLDPSNPVDENIQLPLCTSDVIRSATGEWFVTSDAGQYPTGLGYALENRVVLSRVLRQEFSERRITRLVGYFRQLKRHISALGRGTERCVFLSYPSGHPNYFEFAWLSKYLGFPLVEPADLTVRDNVVSVRTTHGLQVVDVILRFMDERQIDPVIIGSQEQQGVPGLVEAARRGGVKIINPLGAGVVANPAWHAIMPELCEELLDEPLRLPSLPTYWLGWEDVYQRCLQRVDQLRFQFINDHNVWVDPSRLSPEAKSAFLDKMAKAPCDFVAREHIARSTAPSVQGGALEAQKIAVRTFQVIQGESFETLAGGLCLTQRLHSDTQATIGTKDVWVLSKRPVGQDSLFNDNSNTPSLSLLDDELPSRIAENFFWLGRNAERVESCLRLLRGIFQGMLDEESALESGHANAGVQALLRALTISTSSQSGFIGRGAKRRIAQPDRDLKAILQDVTRMGSLASMLIQWQYSASAANDRLSGEQLRVFDRIDSLQTSLQSLELSDQFCSNSDELNEVIHCIDAFLLATSAFAGLSHENITHTDLWGFLMLGRSLERAHQIIIKVGAVNMSDSENDLVLEYSLRLFDSVMTYRARYSSTLDSQRVLSLLLMDVLNPRSLAYQFVRIEKLVDTLPGRKTDTSVDVLKRLAFTGSSRVRLAEMESLLNAGNNSRQSLPKFLKVLEELPTKMTNAITKQYFTHTESRYDFGQPAPLSNSLSVVSEETGGLQ